MQLQNKLEQLCLSLHMTGGRISSQRTSDQSEQDSWQLFAIFSTMKTISVFEWTGIISINLGRYHMMPLLKKSFYVTFFVLQRFFLLHLCEVPDKYLLLDKIFTWNIESNERFCLLLHCCCCVPFKHLLLENLFFFPANLRRAPKRLGAALVDSVHRRCGQCGGLGRAGRLGR